MNLVLANRDYHNHMTDEGEQLQVGLQRAGWLLAGAGYTDGTKDVPQLLERHQPERVFVQDCRDWRADSRGCFDKSISFDRWERLAKFPAQRFTVCKDAGTVSEYQQAFAETIQASAIVVYYHPQSVRKLSPWLKDYRLIRTFHSVDRHLCDAIDCRAVRQRALVSGAAGNVYPLRQLAIANASNLKITHHRHPGYGNRGCATPEYLKLLAGFRVHVACASAYGFALRKIIESVAMGAIPVTDLPAADVLPQIDGALFRVKPGATKTDLADAIDEANRAWVLEERLEWARLAREWYDFRAIGWRLSEEMCRG